MDIQALLAKVRRIEIKSKALSNQIFTGDYQTAFKGRGMSFAEVREYNYGDDTRNIDWNVSARFGHPYIKLYQEERELTFMLLIDVSNSNLVGTQNYNKQQLIAELSATLAFSALNNNDKVGAIFFSNKIEAYMPPKKGKNNVLQILRKILAIKPSIHPNTNIGEALVFLYNLQKRKTITFLVSDFNSVDFKKQVALVANKHYLYCLHVYDKAERELPKIGLVKAQDIETKSFFYVNTNNKIATNAYTQQFDDYYNQTATFIKKNKGKWLSISTAEDYIKPLHSFFSK